MDLSRDQRLRLVDLWHHRVRLAIEPGRSPALRTNCGGSRSRRCIRETLAKTEPVCRLPGGTDSFARPTIEMNEVGRMMVHTVESTTEIVRSGFLDPSAPPVVTVESCDVVSNIDDGGVADPAFFDHVARFARPVLASPKRYAAPMPLLAWTLLHPVDDARPTVTRTTRTLIDQAAPRG